MWEERHFWPNILGTTLICFIPGEVGCLLPLGMYLECVRTHAGVLVPMDMTPETKTRVPTTAAGSSQAV